MDKQLKTPIYWQTECLLPAMKRGFHLITDAVEEHLVGIPIETGLVHLFLQHTSASLTISENASLEVLQDLESYFCKAIPDSTRLYRHNIEGEDDMPAHIKNVLLGVNLTIPLVQGRLALGQWQGIYLGEHRNHASARRLLISAHGI